MPEGLQNGSGITDVGRASGPAMTGHPGLDQDESIKVKPWILVPIILAALVSELVIPMPSWLLARCWLLGSVVGLCWMPRITILSWIGLGVILLGQPALFNSAYRRSLDTGEVWQSRWAWQITLVTWGVVALVASAPAILARISRRYNVS